jgi:hypothetical protein
MGLTKRLAGFRFVEIRQDDTLQKIAARELDDANLWRELIAINDLAPPYLTGDLALAGPKVKRFGQSLAVPATTAPSASPDDPDRVFGTDILLLNGRLQATSTGDLALVSGVANLMQALGNRLETPLGDLLFYRNYGFGGHRLKGKSNVPGTATLAAKYAESSLLDDPRVSSVPKSSATVTGDRVDGVAIAQPITGVPVNVPFGA